VALDSDVRITAHYRNAPQEEPDVPPAGGGGPGGGGGVGGGTGGEGGGTPSDDSGLDRIRLEGSDVVRSGGSGGSGLRPGEQVNILTEFTNPQGSEQSYAMIIQIEDPQGFTADLGWVTGSLEAGETTDASRSWTAREPGQYTVEMFAWDRVDEAPTPLSEVTTETISVS
jgi:hypothetical protein